jgi:PAS domain S-box-containing protein
MQQHKMPATMKEFVASLLRPKTHETILTHHALFALRRSVLVLVLFITASLLSQGQWFLSALMLVCIVGAVITVRYANALLSQITQLEKRLQTETQEALDASEVRWRQIQQDLAKERNLLRTVIDILPDNIFVKDKEGHFLLNNAVSLRMLGVERQDDLIGKTDFDLLPKKLAEESREHELAVLQSGEPIIEQEVFQPWQTEHWRWFVFSTIPLRDEKGEITGLVGMTTDITSRKRVEEARKEAEILRIELEKERELRDLKNSFMSMIVHDFRNPLAAVQLILTTMRQYSARLDKVTQDGQVKSALEQLGHLNQLVEEVLALSRMERSQPTFHTDEVNLNELCQRIIQEYAQHPDSLHQFHYQNATIPIFIQGDTQLLYRALSNLVSNAIKYSPKGGDIRLTLGLDDAGVKLTVSDNGIGIPEKDQTHLFEPFHRASNVGTLKGTGLGLAIVKQIVELHRGVVSYESVLNQGTTFTLKIPSQIPEIE